MLARHGARLQLVAVAAAMILLVAWYAWPTLQAGGLIGAPQTDIIRAVWGLDHAWESAPNLSFWTGRMAFPVGVKIVILPQFSATVGSPLVGLWGAVGGFNAWILVLWAMAGFGSAFLAWTLTDSAAAALLAGTVLLIQPMLFLAISDGTSEFVAWWAVPAALGALYVAGRVPAGEFRTQFVWWFASGALLGIVALDSPYHAVFCLPFLPLVVRWKRWRRMGPLLLALIAMGVFLSVLYYGLPLSAPNDNAAENAVSLLVWQKWETGDMPREWDYTLGTGFIPALVVLALVGCALLRRDKSLPWLGIGALALLWSLNENGDNPQFLRSWFGNTGLHVSDAIVWFNSHLTPPIIRFPRRWLIPASQALAVAAAIGLTGLPKEWMRWAVAAPLCLFMVVDTESLTRFRANMPHFEPPTPAFATYIAESAEKGAVLYLPRVRAAAHATTRTELPVFAEISRDIASADQLWLQVLCRRPSTYWPDGLRTVVRRKSYEPEIARLLHGLDDASNPQTIGTAMPPSSTEEPDRRQRIAGQLVSTGLSFVAIDEKVYADEGLALVRQTFAPETVEERHFDDGTGVTVLRLQPAP